ncbi:Calcium-activated chloride channel [Fragilaria crotonensis]|nr:Calcium-activated chloride channel [Fragilaria crotonensis]
MTIGRKLARFLSVRFPSYDPSSQRRTLDRENNAALPSLDAAWAYFEHSQLPRHKVDTMDEDKQDSVAATLPSSSPAFGLVARHVRRLRNRPKDCIQRADYGERTERTRLYNVLTTPESALAEFGMSVGIYFWTLRILASISLIAGLLSLPTMIYFSSTKYNSNVNDVKLGILGSAVCSDSDWVPCPTCTRSDWDLFPSTYSRFATSGDLTFILRNNCEIRFSDAIVAMVVLVFVCISFFVMNLISKRREVQLDEESQTTSDYSVQVMNPPSDAFDPDEWKEFFSQFDDAKVAVVTVAVDNEALIRTLEKRRTTIQQMKYLIQPGIQFDPTDLDKMANQCLPVPRWKRYFLLQKSAEELQLKVKKIEAAAEALAREEMNVSTVFVTFDTERSQRLALNALSSSGLQRLLRPRRVPGELKFRGQYTLHVVEPAEPSSVRWHNLDESLVTKVTTCVLSFIVSCAAITFGAYLVYLAGQTSPIWASLTVTGINQVTPRICKFISNWFESHSSDGSYQASLYVKMTIFKWVNTAVVTAIITPFVFTVDPGSTKLINKVYAIFFAELLVNPLILISDAWGHIQRHILGPREVDQERMNLRFTGGSFLVALRYTEMTKIIFLTFFYSAIFPAGYFFAAASLAINYIVDKFCLLRSYGPAPKVGNDVAKFSRSFFFTSALVVYVLMVSYTFAGFPFDNACNTFDNVTSDYVGSFNLVTGDGQSVASITIDESNTAYSYCLQDMFKFRNPSAFPAIPQFQREGSQWMTPDQESATRLLGWTSVVVIFLIALMLSRTIFNLTLRKLIFRPYRPTGKASSQRFSETTGRYGYVPRIKSPRFQYPLLACNISAIDPELVDWSDPSSSFPFDEHNLIYDVPGISSRCDKQVFSVVKSWHNI